MEALLPHVKPDYCRIGASRACHFALVMFLGLITSTNKPLANARFAVFTIFL